MDKKGIGAVHWRDVFFRLARVAHGTQAEKAGFLFAIMDDDGSGDLQTSEVMRFLLMSAEGGGAPRAYREAMEKLIESYSVSTVLVASRVVHHIWCVCARASCARMHADGTCPFVRVSTRCNLTGLAVSARRVAGCRMGKAT